MAAALMTTAAAAALALAACASPPPTGSPTTSTTPGDPAPTAQGPSSPGTTEERSVAVGGAERAYALHTPGAPDPAPDLVVVLHWWGGSMEEAASAHRWAETADRDGFLVAFGSGIDHAWNAGGCCGTAQERRIDDLAYIEALIADVGAERDIRRVVVAGTSNGAMMALRFGCESDIEADIAAVSGSLFVDCDDAPPRNVIMVNGLADETVRYDGEPGGSGIDGWPVADAFARWREIDRCGEPTRSDSADGVVHIEAAACDGGLRAQLVTIEGAGHQWPYNEYDATAWIVEFLGIGA